MHEFHVIIPARYGSSRLPGKPLLDIAGKPMIVRVVEAATASGAKSVTVATDDQRITDCVQGFGGSAVITCSDHGSGTDRIAEACQLLGLDQHAIVVNVQGDEPLIPSALISQVAALLADGEAEMATLCVPIRDAEEFTDPNVVKVVCGADGRALYFSRAPIPWMRGDGGASLMQEGYRSAYRHLGIYAYRADYVQAYAARPACPIEQSERLEQLRVLWHGETILCGRAENTPESGVDSPEDLERVRRIALRLEVCPRQA